MKKIVLIHCLSLICMVMPKAQMNILVIDPNEVLKAEEVDNSIMNVQYEMTFLSDVQKPDSRQTEMMILKVGNKSSIYYSYAKFLTDSIIEADKLASASIEVIQDHLSKFQGKVNYKIYKNYPSGKVTTLDQIAATKFRCEENNEVPGWELTADTMSILSYPCRKAICTFKGRTYEAWYTEEIPRSEGPWKLHGLPGLILKVEDTEGHYTFNCTGLQKVVIHDPIMYADSGHEPIGRKDLNKIYERFAKDPLGYISTTSPHVKVTVKNNSGETITPRDLPYNPIEL